MGIALAFFPGAIVVTAAVLIGLAWVVVGIAAVWVTLNADSPPLRDYESTQQLLGTWTELLPKRAEVPPLTVGALLQPG